MKRLILMAMIALLLSTGLSWGSQFEDGMAAHARGDYVSALKIFRSLAAQGDPKAQYNLGQMSLEGQGIAQNYPDAAKWFRLAAVQGDALAQHNLAVLYENGQGIAQDYSEARKWYRLAAAQGIARSQSNLGLMYGKGQGGPKDLLRAHMWLSLGAMQGNANAAKNRDVAEKMMTSQQITEAQKMARKCQQQNLKDCD